MKLVIWRFGRRLAVILAGYLAAALIGGFIFLVKELAVSLISHGRLEVMFGEIAVSDYLFVSVMMVGLLSAIPATAIIAFTELKRHAGLRFYVISGAAIPILVFLFFLLVSPVTSKGDPFPESILFELVFLAIPTGAFCGTVYWLIAGRTAGSWRNVTAPPSAGS